MSGFGAFSTEAYQQLQDAYAAQLLAADEAEQNGVEIDGEKLGVETLAVPSPWLEKTGLWQYPSGRGDYLDTKQTQEDLLAALQDDDDESSASDELSDEELDQLINELLDELDEDEEEKTVEEITAEIETLKAELAELTSETDQQEEEEDSE